MRVFTFTYEESAGKKYNLERWMAWWNNIGKFKKESLQAKRERDKRYYNKHRDMILKKRREDYEKTKENQSQDN